MKRRNFLKNTAMAGVLASIPGITFPNSHNKGLKNIGVQLFSLPRLLETDFRAGIELIANLGYKEVELYGPFPFTVDEVKASWKALEPMLGFNGSGYFGHTATELKAILDDYGLVVNSIHTDLQTMQTRMDELGEAAEELGFEYIGLPAIPEDKRKTLDDYRRIATEFNSIGEQARKVDLKFAYHNHGYGLKEENGHIPLNLILENTDPKLVFFEMDIFWTSAGGANPVDYLENYPNRYRLMHVKDMKEKVYFSGDGGSPSEWFELFPYMTSAGSGVMDLKSIISSGIQNGVKHFYVEQDMVAQPEVALKSSINFLKTLR